MRKEMAKSIPTADFDSGGSMEEKGRGNRFGKRKHVTSDFWNILCRNSWSIPDIYSSL